MYQYLSSKSFVQVDWKRLTGSYNDTFGTKLPTGDVRVPTVGGAWAWMVDFLTANFQREPEHFTLSALTDSCVQNERPSSLDWCLVSVWARQQSRLRRSNNTSSLL